MAGRACRRVSPLCPRHSQTSPPLHLQSSRILPLETGVKGRLQSGVRCQLITATLLTSKHREPFRNSNTRRSHLPRVISTFGLLQCPDVVATNVQRETLGPRISWRPWTRSGTTIMTPGPSPSSLLDAFLNHHQTVSYISISNRKNIALELLSWS